MKRSVQLCVSLLLYAVLILAQDPRCLTAGNLSVADDDVLFHQFFPSVDYLKPTGNPQGHQNTTWCCILAVIQYLRDECSNTTSIQIDERILDPASQFPCGAVYAGDSEGAPVVRVSYSWMSSHCPGWEISQARIATQWLQTLVGFLLPSVVFALNVPRGYEFPLRDSLFARGPLWRELYLALVAILSATVDTTFWLCIVFAMSGPLLLSGSLEAVIDYNVIRYMQAKDEERKQSQIDTTQLPLALRARILFTILGGNLELTTAWKHVMNLAQDLDGLDNPTSDSQTTTNSEADVRPLFRERIFSFDIEANDIQPDLHRSDLDSEDRKLIRSHVREESPISSETSDQDGQGSALTLSASPLSTSFQRSRTMSDPSQISRPLPLARLSYQGAEESPFKMSYLAPPLPGGERSGRRRHTEKDSSNFLVHPQKLPTTCRPDSDKSVGNKELQRSIIGRQYLEMYKREKRKKKTVGRIDQRLKAMLACQYGFGSTVGAPVVFYVGSFVYALIEIIQSYGDNDVSHALAFGSWWMIIPHIAALSGLLLGGNNPNTLGAIIGAKEKSKLQYAFGRTKPNSPEALDDETRYEAATAHNRKSAGARHHDLVESFLDRFLERVYSDSIYTPVSMWDRGRSKQTWLLILCAESWSSYDWYEKPRLGAFKRELIDFLHETVMLSYAGRISVICTTFLLLFIPCILGFLTAFFTPQVGVSCRSLTVLLYMMIQALLLVLWGLRMTYFDEYWRYGRRIVKAYRKRPQVTSSQVNQAFWNLRELAHKDVIAKFTETKLVWWQYAFHFLLILLPFIAIFSAIGGTVLQITGVFRCTLCHFNVTEWVKHSSVMAVISTNDQQDILTARHDWIAVGATSISFLSVTCFSGWVYQKRARHSFNELAIQLGEDIQKRCSELDKDVDSKVAVNTVK